MIPADLASRAKRWRFSSSVEAAVGADSATVEYAPIDAATFQAVADTFNAASPADSYSIMYEEDGRPTELFRGQVVDWRLEARWDRGSKETVAILEALDDRARLYHSRLDPVRTFRGVEVLPDGQRLPHSSFAGVVRAVCAEAGLPIQVSADYTLSRPVVPLGLSMGQLLESLIAPLQQVRSARADFARDGQMFTIKARSLVLGAADLQIAQGLVSLESYRRSRPMPPDDTPPQTPAQEFDSGDGGEIPGEVPEMPPRYEGGSSSLVESVDIPATDSLPSGTITRFYGAGGRLWAEETLRYIRLEDGTQVEVFDRRDYIYDTRGRLLGHDSTTYHNKSSVPAGRRRVRAATFRILMHGITGRILGEQTIETEYSYETGRQVEQKIATLARAQAEGGVQKCLMRETAALKSVQSDPRVFEFSPGEDASGEAEPGAGPGPGGTLRPDRPSGLMSEPQDIEKVRRDARRQAGRELAPGDPAPPPRQDLRPGRDLIEVSIAAPLDPRFTAGKVLEITGGLVGVTRFYITNTNAEWSAGQGSTSHLMTIQAEAWV